MFQEMSLTKLLKSPLKLFAKDVITFFVISRHDLGLEDDRLRYIAVKPTASISVLRHKIWYILDLPDFCEEIIILKNGKNVKMPLTELRKGNDPQTPYKLEVWLPEKKDNFSISAITDLSSNGGNMLTMAPNDEQSMIESGTLSSISSQEKLKHNQNSSLCTCIERPPSNRESNITSSRKQNDTINKYYQQTLNNKMNYKKADLTPRVSSTSMFFKVQSRRSKDNFANILLKIQSDLSSLSTKLSKLEDRIHV